MATAFCCDQAFLCCGERWGACGVLRWPFQVLSYAISNLDAYLPSMACLRGEAYDFVVSTAAQFISEIKKQREGAGEDAAKVRMLDQFNFAQLLQVCRSKRQGTKSSCSVFPGRKQSTFRVAASMQPSRRGSRSVPESCLQRLGTWEFTGRYAHLKDLFVRPSQHPVWRLSAFLRGTVCLRDHDINGSDFHEEPPTVMPAGYRCHHTPWFHVPQRAQRALRSQGPGLLAACFRCLAKAGSKASRAHVRRRAACVCSTRHFSRVSPGVVHLASGKRDTKRTSVSIFLFCRGAQEEQPQAVYWRPLCPAESGREWGAGSFRLLGAPLGSRGTSRAVRRRCSWWCRTPATWCWPASPVSRAPRPRRKGRGGGGVWSELPSQIQRNGGTESPAVLGGGLGWVDGAGAGAEKLRGASKSRELPPSSAPPQRTLSTRSF